MPRLLRYYAKIWLRLVQNSFQTQMATWVGSAGYLIGKLLRLGFFLGYLLAIFSQLPGIQGYTMPEIVLFFMTFNLVDVGAQFLFRGLYGVKVLIEDGDFDKILTQPAHVLFRISVMGTDLLDLLTLFPIGVVTVWTLQKLSQSLTWQSVVIYLVLMANAIVIAYAFHVIIAGLSVKTQEMESGIWIYRDVMALGRFPISIYSDVMRGLFVTVVPVGVMITFPTEALLSVLSWKSVGYALGLGLIFHFAAQAFWRRMLMEYTSIST